MTEVTEGDLNSEDYGAFWPERIHVGSGWWSLLADTHRQLSEVWPEYEIAQVKEKWGGLRIYLRYPLPQDDSDDLALWRLHGVCEAILEAAEAESMLTCEYCGAPGVRRDSGWIKTTCDADSGGAAPSSLRSVRSGAVVHHWRPQE